MLSMSFITLLSTLAIVIGLASGVPQLAAMLRSRSAAGQSALGWSLGVFVNTLMAYVNFAGYHATALAAGNLLSVATCLTAVGLVLRFGGGTPEPAPAPVTIPVSDLATHEFWALRDHLEDEAQRRSERQLAAA
jgi:hypothetical protein